MPPPPLCARLFVSRLTWLAGLLHLLGHTSHQLGHDLGSSDLFLRHSLPLPQVARLGRLQQKHVVRIEGGAHWLHLCVCVFQREAGREKSVTANGRIQHDTWSAATKTNLDSTGAFGGALAYVVESNTGWFAVAVLAGPTQVDHQGFILEQADQVRRLLALRDTDLTRPDRSQKPRLISAQGDDGLLSSLPGWLFDPANHPRPR